MCIRDSYLNNDNYRLEVSLRWAIYSVRSNCYSEKWLLRGILLVDIITGVDKLTWIIVRV